MQCWKAWYTEDRKYLSDEYSWEELPQKGIVGVVVYHQPPYRKIVDGGDWYWLENGMIYTSETHDEWGKFVDPPDVSKEVLKKSGVTSDHKFRQIQKEMLGDKEWL